jgi:hypothetical protein
VFWQFVLVYVASAVVTTIIVFVASERVGDERRPATQRVSLSIAAGLFWPLLLLGVFELGSFMLYTKAHRRDDPELDVSV